jgi:hypothetical protein
MNAAKTILSYYVFVDWLWIFDGGLTRVARFLRNRSSCASTERSSADVFLPQANGIKTRAPNLAFALSGDALR